MGTGHHYQVSSGKCLRKVVTIPPSSGTAVTMAALAALTEAEINKIIGMKICGLLSDGSGRAAISIGDVVGTMSQVSAASADYIEPAIDDAIRSYIKALADTQIANTVVVFYLGPT